MSDIYALSSQEELEMALRLKQVRQLIHDAAVKVDRNPDEITLIGVSKFFPAAAAIAAFHLGLHDLGENRVQEMLAKQAILQPLGLTPNWHLIGTLQKNKVKYLIGKTSLIHSVDSADLLEEISRRSQLAGVITDVLLQVNTAEEASKHGFSHEEILDQAGKFASLSGIRMCGLMTMAPLFDDPDLTVPVFASTQSLLKRLQLEHPDWADFQILSMGMSHDFAQAIACGATHVRIGTAIFGTRTKL